MLSLTRTLPRALGSQARRCPALLAPRASAYISSSSSCASREGDASKSPRMQGKDQVQAEQKAKDPKKMSKLSENENAKRDDPHQTSGDVSTPGVKGKSRKDESIGRNINNTTSG